MVEVRAATATEEQRLVAFAYGTFHTVVLIVSSVVVLHLTGALAGLLSGLNTLTGLALFAALWTTTVWSTGRALRGVPGPMLAASMPIGEVVIRATRSGAVNGIAFLVAAEVILALSTLLAGQAPAILIFVASAIVAVPVAAAIGAIVGVVYAAIDLLHVWAVQRLLRGSIGTDLS